MNTPSLRKKCLITEFFQVRIFPSSNSFHAVRTLLLQMEALKSY